MADDTGLPHEIPFLEAADPPSIHGITADMAAQIAERLGFVGKTNISTAETRTSSSYGLLATPDRVQSVVLPTDGLLEIAYFALWKTPSGASGNARAAIFIGSNQLKISDRDTTTPQTQAAGGFGENYRALHTAPFGLISADSTTTDLSVVTTGQAVGSLSAIWSHEVGGVHRTGGSGAIGESNDNVPLGGPVTVFAAAGTYDISVQFKTSAGTISVKDRSLWVRALPF